ncbi:MAG: glycosyltransferase family 4 protein [Saprospiraceae bacterium]|nr:glycosyltransferase family 4 protein [Saprospiraceae bacterium]
MKIGFDAKRLFLNNTGLGNYSRTLVKNMEQFFPEHEYILYTPRIVENDATRYFLQDNKFVIKEGPAIFSSYWRSKGIVKDLLKDGIDIYHGLSHEIPLGLSSTDIRSCVSVHDLIFEVYPKLFNFIDRKLYQLKYKSSAIRADTVIAISESTAHDIESFWNIRKDKIEIVYQSAGEAFFRETRKEDLNRNHFLYVGSIIERKGLLDIIIAYNKCMEDRDMPPFKVIGRGKSYFKACKNKVAELGLSNKIQFIGEVNNSELIKYYDEAIILIYPSVYEGFGIPIIEASLRKTPVICSNKSSMPEAGGPHALYVGPGDVNGLSDAMNFCLDNPDEVAFQAEKSYLYARNRYNASETAHSLLSIYRKMKG